MSFKWHDFLRNLQTWNDFYFEINFPLGLLIQKTPPRLLQLCIPTFIPPVCRLHSPNETGTITSTAWSSRRKIVLVLEWLIWNLDMWFFSRPFDKMKVHPNENSLIKKKKKLNPLFPAGLKFLEVAALSRELVKCLSVRWVDQLPPV